MDTTAGPTRHPRYMVWSADERPRPLAQVHRDPVNPRRWVASYPGRRRAERVPFVDAPTRRAAEEHVRELDASGAL